MIVDAVAYGNVSVVETAVLVLLTPLISVKIQAGLSLKLKKSRKSAYFISKAYITSTVVLIFGEWSGEIHARTHNSSFKRKKNK